jgi:hypothetical protein
VIYNHHVITYRSGDKEHQVETPEQLRIREAHLEIEGTKALITLEFESDLSDLRGLVTIEGYGDCKDDEIAQSRFVMVTLGGYVLGDLPGDGSPAVFYPSAACLEGTYDQAFLAEVLPML